MTVNICNSLLLVALAFSFTSCIFSVPYVEKKWKFIFSLRGQSTNLFQQRSRLWDLPLTDPFLFRVCLYLAVILELDRLSSSSLIQMARAAHSLGEISHYVNEPAEPRRSTVFYEQTSVIY
jgi:hypothetical protein